MANGDAFYGWPRFVFYDTNKNFLGYTGTDFSVNLMHVNDITKNAPSGSVYFRVSINGAVRFSISTGYSFRQDKGGFGTDGSIANDAFTHIKTYLPIAELTGAAINWVEDSNNGDIVEEVTYTITNNLTNCITNNTNLSIVKGSSYNATISANSGYELSSLTVTMGGADITSSAVSGSTISISNVTGDIVITANANEIVEVITYTITNNLTNCTTNNNTNSVNANSSYSATISANSGYTLGSIAVTMGGSNITSSAVSGSRVSINSVTGDVVITASATATAPTEPTEPTEEQWTTTPQTITANKRYLWSYQVITLTNGTTIETEPCVIGVYGGTGSSTSSSADISITVNDANYTATDNVITLPNYLTIPKDKKITILGDSITYGYDGTNASLVEKPYPWIIQDLLGVPVYNYGISGSTISGGGASTSIPGNAPMNIRYADMVYADYVLVLGGVNDYIITSTPLGTKGDTTNQTFYGALKILIEGLITKYPTGKIGFMTPLRKENDTTPNVAGFTLKQYRDAIIDMCEDYCIPVLDLYTKGGCHPNIEAWKSANLPDGLHPNQSYYRRLALQIAQFIQSI